MNSESLPFGKADKSYCEKSGFAITVFGQTLIAAGELFDVILFVDMELNNYKVKI
jgi:hypothetical protein